MKLFIKNHCILSRMDSLLINLINFIPNNWKSDKYHDFLDKFAREGLIILKNQQNERELALKLIRHLSYLYRI
jgi:hypothetical protein